MRLTILACDPIVKVVTSSQTQPARKMAPFRGYFCTLVILGLTLSVLAGPAGIAAAQASRPAAPAVPGADWALEYVKLKDGKQYTGLIKSESPTSVEFVEVHRPPGKPMFLVVRTIDRKAIADLNRLDEDQHDELFGRLEVHKLRTMIEASQMVDLPLTSRRRDGQVVWEYKGTWFSLESTASEAMTRRSIVRLEQIFAAYRQVLPPRSPRPVPLEFHIFGDSDQYQQALAALGLSIKNPAVYLQQRNVILAGSNMNRFDEALAEVARQHHRIRAELDALVAETPSRIKDLQETLKKNDVPAAERQKILVAETKKWEEQRKSARHKIAAVERENAAKFDQVAGQMFRRLAHEAFHAYLESFVYPRDSYDVPRWLNEGLAQTFEAGLLEADSLRIDAPNRVALERLQSDLAGGNPLSLVELLEAGGETFLAGHADDGQAVSRAYYYSWGLAYYLAFEQGVLGTADLEAYLTPAANMSAVARFEKLVGMPLPQFEPRCAQPCWR